MQRYRAILEAIDLTYPQYITLMALWEKDEQTVNQLGGRLFLDNGTLTPLLKRLENKSLITRTRSKDDERVVKIRLTQQGLQLKERASCIPMQLFEALKLDYADMVQLKALAEKIIKNAGEN